MLTRHTFTRLAIAVCSIALTACTSYEIAVEERPVTHQPLRIVTATSPLEMDAAPIAQEMIKTYTLVYINKDTRRVEAIQNVSKADRAVEYDVASFPIEISEQGGVDRHEYKVYAFANFTDDMKAAAAIDGSKTLASVAVGDVLASDYGTTIASATLDLAALNGHDFTKGSQYIPMTAVVDYNATMQYHQPVNVPLVRMLAKLDYKITNRTGAPIEIDKITMRPAYNMPVYVLPHIKGEEVGFYPERPAADEGQYGEAGSDTNDRSYGYIPVLPADPATASDTTAVSLACTGSAAIANDGFSTYRSMYVNESLAKWHPTGHFTYDVAFTTNGEKRQYRYALSADDFTAFCRNDHVTIPLVITSPSSLEPEVLFYPPIGGYPPVLADKADGEFYATFSTPGDFAIYPHIYREGARTDIRLTDGTQVEFDVDDPAYFSISGDNIFSKPLRYVSSDNCFRGTLGTTKGHAIVTLTVRMLDSNRLVTKKMHIIRE